MGTILIIGFMACLGLGLVIVSLFQKKSNSALCAASQMLLLPAATHNILKDSSIMWKFFFIGLLVSGLISVYDLAKNTKEK